MAQWCPRIAQLHQSFRRRAALPPPAAVPQSGELQLIRNGLQVETWLQCQSEQSHVCIATEPADAAAWAWAAATAAAAAMAASSLDGGRTVALSARSARLAAMAAAAAACRATLLAGSFELPLSGWAAPPSRLVAPSSAGSACLLSPSSCPDALAADVADGDFASLGLCGVPPAAADAPGLPLLPPPLLPPPLLPPPLLQSALLELPL